MVNMDEMKQRYPNLWRNMTREGTQIFYIWTEAELQQAENDSIEIQRIAADIRRIAAEEVAKRKR